MRKFSALTVLLTITLVAQRASAQRWTLGLEGGYTSESYQRNDPSENGSSGGAPYINKPSVSSVYTGLTARRRLPKGFFLETGLLFRGYRSTLSFKQFEQIRGKNAVVIQVPAWLGYSFGLVRNRLTVAPTAGVSLNVVAGAGSHTQKGASGDLVQTYPVYYYEENTRYKSPVFPLAGIGLSVGFRISQHLGVQLAARQHFGLTDVREQTVTYNVNGAIYVAPATLVSKGAYTSLGLGLTWSR